MSLPMIRRSHRLSLTSTFALGALALASFAGCGDDASTSSGGGGQAAQGGGGPGQGGGAQGGGDQGGAGGGLAECAAEPPEAGQFAWSHEGPDGTVADCEGSDDLELDLVGTIAAGSDGGTWLIDACSPAADCLPMLHTLTVTTDVDLTPPPVGTFVHLVAKLQHQSGPTPLNCHQELIVNNEPAFGGLMNPTATDTLPWLDPIDTDDGPFDTAYSPYCAIYSEPDPVCGDVQTFSTVRVLYAADTTLSTGELLGGESGTLVVPDGDGGEVSFTAHDALMSHGYCENPGSQVVWVRRTL